MSVSVVVGSVLSNSLHTFSYDRVEASPYDKYQAGLFYATKGGLVGEDWDILGNNLKQDGIDYANKGN